MNCQQQTQSFFFFFFGGTSHWLHLAFTESRSSSRNSRSFTVIVLVSVEEFGKDQGTCLVAVFVKLTDMAAATVSTRFVNDES